MTVWGRGGEREKLNKKKTKMLVRVCIPLALEGEDGEERMTGFFMVLLGL